MGKISKPCLLTVLKYMVSEAKEARGVYRIMKKGAGIN
jgi:hypothetical protein